MIKTMHAYMDNDGLAQILILKAPPLHAYMRMGASLAASMTLTFTVHPFMSKKGKAP